MIVKCPYCGYNTGSQIDILALHLRDNHRNLVLETLTRLIFKIYENIEELETCIAMNKQDKYSPPEANKGMELVSQELKSLLGVHNNEKKPIRNSRR